jgi:hypothetical protein
MTMINMQIAFNLFDSVVFQLYAPHSGGLEKVLLFFSEKRLAVIHLRGEQKLKCHFPSQAT